jgi:excisionase family DNA binding protein
MTKRFHTPQELAELLRVSSTAIRRLLRRGELPALRIGRAWRVEDAELQRWIRHRRWPGGRRDNGRGEPCLCGCGRHTRAPGARFLPGHSGKLVHRLMADDGLTFDAARKAVRQMQRPRVQERLF